MVHVTRSAANSSFPFPLAAAAIRLVTQAIPVTPTTTVAPVVVLSRPAAQFLLSTLLLLLPHVAHACRFLIAAGDPCQLPPVLASPTGVTPPSQPQAPAAAHLSNLNNSSQSGGAANRPSLDQQQQQQQRPVVYGLLRPLFVRLTHLGHVPHLLTHQYRSVSEDR